MKTRARRTTGWMARIAVMMMLTGCAALHQQPAQPGAEPFDAERVVATLTPEIENLYLAWHDLDQIYKDLKFLERGFLLDPDDRQLAYIQRAALYIQDASVRANHAWQQLSVLGYIRPDRMRDYLTVTVNALTEAINAIGYDDQFIDIYGAFIRHDAVQADLSRARNQMETIAVLLKGIRNRLAPMTNQKNSNATPSSLVHNTRPLRLTLLFPSVKGIRMMSTSPVWM